MKFFACWGHRFSMTEQPPLRPFWFCLTLALAFSLAALGLVIILDNLIQGSVPASHIPLRLAGGIASLMVSGALLALLFKYPRLCRALAGATLVFTLPLAIWPYTGSRIDAGMALSPATFAIIATTCVAQLNALNQQPYRWIGLCCGSVLFMLGTVSLFSQWFPSLFPVTVGSVRESNIIISPMVCILGLATPRLAQLHRSPNPALSGRILLLGLIGITITLGSWQGLRLERSMDLQQRAESFKEQVGAALAADYTHRLSLVRRLAERWGRLHGTPGNDDWDLEVTSYFRDYPEIEAIVLTNPEHDLVKSRFRSENVRQWLNQFLSTPDSARWLHRTVESRSARHGGAYSSDNHTPLSVVAAPISGASGRTSIVITVFNLRNTYSQLLVHQQGNLGLAITLNGVEVFTSDPDIRQSQRAVTSHRASPQDGVEWEIGIYAPAGQQPEDFVFLPLILLTGIGLSFLMMLTHLYWRESEKRAGELGYHLNQERRLRITNERILNFSQDLLCTVDKKGRFSMISPACQTIFGYSQEELLGQPADLLILPEDQDEARELNRQLVAGERQQLRNYRNRHRHRAGHVVTMSWMVEWSPEEQALFCLGRDVTDELVAETLTREREQFFSLSPDMFCIVDLNSHFFEMNQGFGDALGYEKEELLGTSYMDIIAEEDKPRIIAAVEELMDGASIHDLHIRALDRAKRIHWLQLSAILSADDLIYVVARDTTEERETRQRLQESEALLRMAENAARIGGWVLDVESGQTRWSEAVREIHDLPEGNSPTLSEAMDFYVPEDRPVIEQAVRLCIKTGIPFDEELRIRTAKGRERWVRVIGHAVRDEEGSRSQLQGAMQDVTSARQAMEQVQRFAERQATIFESITDAFFTLDRDWRFIYVNTRSEEILHRSREDLLGQSIWEAFPESLGTEFETQYRYAMETGQSVSFEAYYAPLDNWLEVSAYPSEEGLAVYYRSIWERKLAEQKLRETMEELERSNRELQDFAFVASHDLQEPLRKIQAFSDRLISRSKKLDDQEKDYLARMQSAAGRMQALIQDLLSYSRVTTRANPLVSCDPNRILREVVQDMETTISQEQARIHIEPLPELEGDASQIRQVFQNLLSNSVKFHQPEHIPEIFVYPDSVTDDDWTLVFSDRGIGFDPRHAEKLFHPFQRLHQRSQYPGTGIGMAIVKKILDRHGAEVTVDSTPDQGTTFRIRFRKPE
jgi:PAS domain S-box-containing protein